MTSKAQLTRWENVLQERIKSAHKTKKHEREVELISMCLQLIEDVRTLQLANEQLRSKDL